MKILHKIRKFLLFPIRKNQFASFGFHSDIVQPSIISGKANIYIGDSTIIRQWGRIEAIENYQGKTFSPKLTIGNNVMIEQGCHIVCSSNVTVADDTTISSYVFISDTNHSIEPLGENVLKQPIISEDVYIGKSCFIGTGVKIMPGVTIGSNCVIGANSVVCHNIPSYSMAVGIPAKIIKVYNKENNQWEHKKNLNDELFNT